MAAGQCDRARLAAKHSAQPKQAVPLSLRRASECRPRLSKSRRVVACPPRSTLQDGATQRRRLNGKSCRVFDDGRLQKFFFYVIINYLKP